MTADEVLTTTRAVRKRLDLTGPCRERSCASACRSPSGAQRVEPPAVAVRGGRRSRHPREMARIYRDALAVYRSDPQLPAVDWASPANQRMGSSVDYLRDTCTRCRCW